jgi:hypothetical protein
MRDGVKRTIGMNLRLSEREAELLGELADLHGMSRAGVIRLWIRSYATSQTPPEQLNPAQFQQLFREVFGHMMIKGE